jgi:hypothetical protein
MLSRSRRSTRSNNGTLLEPPAGRMLTTLGARSFHAAAPHLWNSLPLGIRSLTSIDLFKKSIKLIFLGTFLMTFYKIRILNFKNVNI